MNELDITNTQAIILLLAIGLLFLCLKRIESHKRDFLERTVENTKQRIKPLLWALYSACRRETQLERGVICNYYQERQSLSYWKKWETT